MLVFDPFSGSGTTGIAALKLGCSYIGFEVDPEQVEASNARLQDVKRNLQSSLNLSGNVRQRSRMKREKSSSGLLKSQTCTRRSSGQIL